MILQIGRPWAYRRKSIAGQWKIKLPFPKDAVSWW